MIEELTPSEEEITKRMMPVAAGTLISITIIISGLYFESLLITTTGLVGFTVFYPILTVLGLVYALNQYVDELDMSSGEEDNPLMDAMDEAMSMFEDIEMPEQEETEQQETVEESEQ